MNTLPPIHKNGGRQIVFAKPKNTYSPANVPDEEAKARARTRRRVEDHQVKMKLDNEFAI